MLPSLWRLLFCRSTYMLVVFCNTLVLLRLCSIQDKDMTLCTNRAQSNISRILVLMLNVMD